MKHTVQCTPLTWKRLLLCGILALSVVLNTLAFEGRDSEGFQFC